ncbi:MAG: YjbQ family protein [Chloroflexi bacterium]|nr:YjbQ family protein [Chloroflexota bacterium]
MAGQNTTVHRFTVRTREKVELQDITGLVRQATGSAGKENGTCYVFVPHTTAGVTINEHADADVLRDIIDRLEAAAPQGVRYHHTEGNGAAHVKASLVGSSVMVFVEGGRPALGTWQGIFLCEFDGPRTREVWVKVVED